MKEFEIKKLLMPIDFSETSMLAIEHAGYMAQQFKAEIILLHVVEKHWEQFSIIAPELRIMPPSDLINMIEAKLAEIAADIHTKYGVKSTAITSAGNIFNEILTISKEHEVDMVVMGTHGTSGVAEFFVGSNTYKMVTESECPVISVQSHATKIGFSDILLPVDNSVHSRQKVNYAVDLAKQFASKIHIMGLADYPENDTTAQNRFKIKVEHIENYLKKVGIPFSSSILPGNNQAVTTMAYAKSINADLIVIMTDQDENLTGRLMGPYAQQVVNHSKIPVMSIQPSISGSNVEWVHPF